MSCSVLFFGRDRVVMHQRSAIATIALKTAQATVARSRMGLLILEQVQDLVSESIPPQNSVQIQSFAGEIQAGIQVCQAQPTLRSQTSSTALLLTPYFPGAADGKPVA